MRINVGSNVKSLLSVTGANMFVMLAGIVQSFLLPFVLSPTEYGYWSMYLLYVGYAGLFNFGVADGIYLIFGGSNYKDLDKSKFNAYFRCSTIYLSILVILWCILVWLLILDYKTRWILLLIGFSTQLACMISLTVMVDQATLRFSIYSKGHIIEKICIMVGVVVTYIFSIKEAIIVILFSVIGRIITLQYYYFNTKPILTAKPVPMKEAIKDIKEFAFAGVWLTMASIGTTALTAIGRTFIQIELGVTELGYYSFVFSLLGLFVTFFAAIGTVLFPMLKKNKGRNYHGQMQNLDCMLNWFGIAILLLYWPSKMILQLLYPQYQPAMHCLIVLYPLAVLLGKNTIIYNTIYRIERMERIYVRNLLMAVGICLLLNFVILKIYKDIIGPAIATYISFYILNTVSVYVFNRKNDQKYQYSVGPNLIVLILVVCNTIINHSTLVIILSYALALLALVIYSTKMIPAAKCLIKCLNQ